MMIVAKIFSSARVYVFSYLMKSNYIHTLNFILFYYNIIMYSTALVRRHSQVIDNPAVATHVPFTWSLKTQRNTPLLSYRFMAAGDSSSAKVVKTRYTAASPRTRRIIQRPSSSQSSPVKTLHTQTTVIFKIETRTIQYAGQDSDEDDPLSIPVSEIKIVNDLFGIVLLCVTVNY